MTENVTLDREVAAEQKELRGVEQVYERLKDEPGLLKIHRDDFQTKDDDFAVIHERSNRVQTDPSFS